MDKILNRICSIERHPIAELERKFRYTYLKGLGACLYIASKDNPITKMFFKVWAQSVLREHKEVVSFWKEDISAIKQAIGLKRKGFRFFSMKYSFFFDVFYLITDSMGYDQDTYQFLREKICGWFTKGALEEVYAYYNNKEVPTKVASELISHRNKNREYLVQPLKKVLVVANVSAGKSTLINALVGHSLNKVRTTACTNKIVKLYNKRDSDGVTIKKANNTYEYYSDLANVDSDLFSEAAFPFNSLLANKNICLVDTPGVNNATELDHRTITEEAIKREDYDMVIYVSNAKYFATTDEKDILLHLYQKVNKPILFVLNQLDQFKQKDDSIAKMLEDYKEILLKIGFNQPIIIPISAKAASLFKQEDSVLDEDDIFEKELLQRKFEKDYYNLAAYTNSSDHTSFLGRTGIIALETLLMN
jgi:hypothetical protein